MTRLEVIIALACLGALVLMTGVVSGQPEGSIVAWGASPLVDDQVTGHLVAITAGAGHSLGLRSDGSVVGWGSNKENQCNVPAPNADFVSISAYGHHSLGLKSDGSIVAWGRNEYYPCNVPSPNADFVAVAGGNQHSLGLKSNGSIVAWGRNHVGQCNVPGPNTDFVAIAGGASFSLGLKSNGSIVAWGDNYFGQCNVPSPNADFVAIAGGHYHSLGLRSDGTIVAWGRNHAGQCNVPSPNADFVAIAAHGDFSLGLKSNGTIVAWGYNYWGQCNVPGPNVGFVAIAAGLNHGVGLMPDGTFVAWGDNFEGQCNVPVPNEDFVAVAAGGFAHSAHRLCLKSDGTIVSWGENWAGQCNVPAPNADFVAVAGGESHSLGLKSDGSIAAWGDNYWGQCSVPTPNEDFVAIAAGASHSLGLKANGTVLAWGRTWEYQCAVPSPNSDFVDVSAGGYHSLGLKSDGSIVAWGRNDRGQCNVPEPNMGFVAVSGGGGHTLGLKADGTVLAWGDNNYGACNVPSPNENFVAIDAGEFSAGLKSDGTIVCWGSNNLGQLNVPAPNAGFAAMVVDANSCIALRAGNGPPVVTVDHSAVTADEAVPAVNSGTLSDPDGDAIFLTASVGTIADNGDGTWSWQFLPTDGPSESQVVTISADDGAGGLSEVTFDLTVNNVAPTVVEVIGPAGPVVIDSQPIRVDATFSDPAGIADEPYAYTVDYGDGSGPVAGTVTGTDCTGPDQTYTAAGTYTVVVTVTDKDGAPGTATTEVVIHERPVVTVDQAAISFDEGLIATNSGSASDPDGDPVTLSASVGTVTDNGDGTWGWSFPVTDGPAESQTVTITGDDGRGGTATVTFDLTATNVAPAVVISLPIDPIDIIDQPVSASATFSDPAGTADEPYSCTFDYGDGSGALAGVVNGTTCTGPDHTYENPGVYSVLVTVTDKDGGTGSATATSYIVLYDPAAGFVTGGGWIDSPAGACPADPDLVGRAHFGFVSRYQRGQTVPDGRTGFRFQAGDLHFRSTSYEWLVVAGPNAKYKGSGTINDEGDYGFMLTATDADIPGGGESDLFRIKIWEKDPEETVVYDNQMGEDDSGYAGTALGGGQIKIQTGGGGPSGAPSQGSDPDADPDADPEVTAFVIPTAYALLGSVPNPFNPSTEIRFDLPEPAEVRLVVYDTMGRAVARLVDGTLPVGEHRVTFDGAGLASGVYFYRLEAGSFTATRSMTLAK